MTTHPKVEYNRESRMSSSEVSVSCCLSISSIILEVDETVKIDKENSDSTNQETKNCDKNGSKKDVSSANHENGDADKSSTADEVEKSMDIDDEDRELIIK